MDQRQLALHSWLQLTLGPQMQLTALAGDASFRRYFRVGVADQSFIAMDAPPENEDCRPFVTVARAFAALGVPVPEVVQENLTDGFLLLSDFGDRLFSQVVNTNNADQLYRQAMQQLLDIQQCTDLALPAFDADFILIELKRFDEWYLQGALGLQLSAAEQKLLENTYQRIIENALEQPQVCVHRDYHSRNLMLLDDNSIGVIDFQDAVRGPITYDLVSLLRDCYITWPQDKVTEWALHFHQQAKLKVDAKQFLRWFDLMGLQRHLKVVGIFARLHLRDGKSVYLNDIPTAVNYLKQTLLNYPEFNEFLEFLSSKALS